MWLPRYRAPFSCLASGTRVPSCSACSQRASSHVSNPPFVQQPKSLPPTSSLALCADHAEPTQNLTCTCIGLSHRLPTVPSPRRIAYGTSKPMDSPEPPRSNALANPSRRNHVAFRQCVLDALGPVYFWLKAARGAGLSFLTASPCRCMVTCVGLFVMSQTECVLLFDQQVV